MNRFRVLLRKELLDVARNRAALFPVLLVTALATALPFAIVFGVPMLTGERLGDDHELLRASRFVGAESLPDNARVQLLVFQEFVLLFLMTPVTGAMAMAAHAVIGEKQARTLEPLLASPVTTAELLLAKVVGSLLPTFAIAVAGAAVYFGGIALFADTGVGAAMFSGRTLVVLFFVGPLAALVALQFAILVSSRVNDARTAQQFAVLIILPLTALIVAQFTGTLWLTAPQLALVGVGLLGVWLLLTAVTVSLFDREAILTKWR